MQYGGIYRALISGNGPGGRVQVTFPWLSSDTALMATTCLPPDCRANYQSGQEVWVMFEQGNFNRPVVVGAAAPGA